MSEKKHWSVLDTLEIVKKGFFRLRSDKCELPDKRVMPHYYVMEFTDWVNVLPITRDGKVILIEQYRHAVGEVCLEIPGGALHYGLNEDPKVAALRELREETGYTPGEIRLVGKAYPNPALQNNQIWTYVALDCEKTGEQELDPFEDIDVRLVEFPELFELIKKGQIKHSLVIQAIHMALPLLGVSVP